jgi:hypothetical protein
MLESDLYLELKILAARENRTVKEILSEQIEKYCKVHKEGNPQHLISTFLENEDFVGFPALAIEFNNKKSYILKNCSSNKKLNPFGQELFGHICQWYSELRKY